jgi:RNA-binding protein Musashi
MKKQDDTQSASKLFIGGLTQTTTKDQLEQTFAKYGQIVDSIVMKNQQTGQSRGFGFVTFKEPASAHKAMQQPNKVDNKTVDVKFCNPRTSQPPPQPPYQQGHAPFQARMAPPPTTDFCKVFVGGLPYGVHDDEIKQFFSRYGPVSLPRDASTPSVQLVCTPVPPRSRSSR